MNNQITIYCNYENKEFFESVLPNFKLKFKKLEHINFNNFSNENILFFCTKDFDINFINKFKGFEKQEVFKYLTEDSNGRSIGEIRWNFEKFLVSREGKLVKRFRSSVDPNQDEISIAIESLL